MQYSRRTGLCFVPFCFPRQMAADSLDRKAPAMEARKEPPAARLPQSSHKLSLRQPLGSLLAKSLRVTKMLKDRVRELRTILRTNLT